MNNFTKTYNLLTEESIFLTEGEKSIVSTIVDNLKGVISGVLKFKGKRVLNAEYIEIPGRFLHPVIGNRSIFIIEPNSPIFSPPKSIHLPVLHLIKKVLRKVIKENKNFDNLEESVVSGLIDITFVPILKIILNIAYKIIAKIIKKIISSTDNINDIPTTMKVSKNDIIKNVIIK